MNREMGVAIVCGQLLIRATRIRHLAVSATRSSHNVMRCGSRASDFTVRMPNTVSVITAALLISDWIIWLMALVTGPRNTRIMMANRHAEATTSQVNVLLK